MNQFQNNIPLVTYPKPFQNSLDCSSIGIPVLPASAPPSRGALSSDDCNSPTQMNQFKRLVEKPSLIKRIGTKIVVSYCLITVYLIVLVYQYFNAKKINFV